MITPPCEVVRLAAAAAGMHPRQVGVASEDVGAALRIALAGGERHVARGADGVVEVTILARRLAAR